MAEEQPLRTVGILNSTEDVIDLLQELLHSEGYATRVAYIPDLKRGRLDVAAWLGDLAPTAIIYDIPPPYEENWNFYRRVRALPAAAPHRFILTTTNEHLLEQIAGVSDAIEFVGKPFDLGEILDRVQLALATVDQVARTQAGSTAR
jgi:DNA-binding response OmpR family regulator